MFISNKILCQYNALRFANYKMWEMNSMLIHVSDRKLTRHHLSSWEANNEAIEI